MSRRPGQRCDHDRLRFAAEAYQRLKETQGAVEPAVQEQLAALAGCSRRHLRRAAACPPAEKRYCGMDVPPGVVVLLFKHRGRIEPAVREWREQQGPDAPCTRTLRRAVDYHVPLHLLASASGGDVDAREYESYLPLIYNSINEVWRGCPDRRGTLAAVSLSELSQTVEAATSGAAVAGAV